MYKMMWEGSGGRLNLDVFDANAGVGLFVLDGFLVALSAFLFEDLF